MFYFLDLLIEPRTLIEHKMHLKNVFFTKKPLISGISLGILNEFVALVAQCETKNNRISPLSDK